MRWDLSGILVCVRCGQPLPPETSWEASGTRCGGCGEVVPVIRGIPRFVASDSYAASFGFEWNRHRKTQLDDVGSRESEETFREKTGLCPTDVTGRLVLDVGCGMGRFSDVVSRWGGLVVGVDISLAVEAAQANLEWRPNVRVLQADLFQLPFAPKTFDIVYSMGVLHHTPDCERAFQTIAALVRPGGRLCVWVYGMMGTWERVARLYRRATVRMPPRLLHALCYFAIPWYHIGRLPYLGPVFRTLIPVSQHPNPAWRVLDTFDWYSPKHQSRHTFPEVYQWFQSEGFVDIRLFDFPVAVAGTRPAQAR